MYYIVKKGSKTYEKLQELREKIKDVKKFALNIANERGFYQIRQKPLKLAGGISSLYSENKPEGFRYTYSKKEANDFYPKKIKANADFLHNINNAPTIDYDELNSIISFDFREHVKDGFWVLCPNYSFHKDFVLFSFSEKVNDKYKPVRGMKEILHSEYKKLSLKK